MRKLKTTGFLQFSVCCLLFLLSAPTHSAPIGELVTSDGAKYTIGQFGSENDKKDYFVKTEHNFIPISEVKAITRVDTQMGRFAYLLILNNGEFATGRQGLLFYENVNFIDPSNGQTKNAYTPVIKDRGQSGFIFTALNEAAQTEKIIEISYPNNIAQISLNKFDNPAEGKIDKAPMFKQRIVKKD